MYIVPAFSGLFAPHWQSSARGVIVGLTHYVNKGHLARAALEATAYQTREVLEAMELDMNTKIDLLRTDGGMVVDDLLMQFQADILGREVIRPVVKETTALGAAYAAALAVGFYKDLAELKEQWRIDRTWQPFMDPLTREALFAQWKRAVSRALDWILIRKRRGSNISCLYRKCYFSITPCELNSLRR